MSIRWKQCSLYVNVTLLKCWFFLSREDPSNLNKKKVIERYIYIFLFPYQRWKPQYQWFFINGYELKNSLRSDRRWATDELALTETRLASGQKQNRTFPGSIILLESLLWLIRPLFGGFPYDRLAHSTKNWIGSGKDLMLPSRFCLKGIIFFFFHFFFLFSVRNSF